MTQKTKNVKQEENDNKRTGGKFIITAFFPIILGWFTLGTIPIWFSFVLLIAGGFGGVMGFYLMFLKPLNKIYEGK